MSVSLVPLHVPRRGLQHGGDVIGEDALDGEDEGPCDEDDT